MQNILIIVHAPPYGSERCLSALRLATALLPQHERGEALVRVFFMSDATVAGLSAQDDGAGNSLVQMLSALAESGVALKLCRTCAVARGIAGAQLLAGVEIGTLPELAQWTMEAHKVVTF